MPKYNRFLNDASMDLVSAVKADEDLSEQEWAYLHSKATPYQRRVARLLVDPTAAPHGSPGTYSNWGCRCDLCKLAHNQARTTASTRADFDDEPSGEAPEPDQIARLREMVKLGQPLTEKGQRILDEYDAAHVI